MHCCIDLISLKSDAVEPKVTQTAYWMQLFYNIHNVPAITDCTEELR